MATSSLSKFTVPLSTDQSATAQGLLMPKLKYRFRVSLENFGVSQTQTELTKQVVNVTRPNITFEEMTLPIYNSTLKLAGRHSWADISCAIRDDASGTISKLIGEQIQKQFDFMEQASAPSGINYKFRLTFDMLDGGNGNIAPVVLESWDLEGCFLSQVDYGDMAYNSNDPALISLNIKFDNATQTYGTGGSNWVTPTPGDAVN